MRYSLLLWPHSNGRYEEAMRLPVQNELSLLLSHIGVEAEVSFRTVSGVNTLTFETDACGAIDTLSYHSHMFWLCEETSGAFLPLSGERQPCVGTDLPFVLKYKGKTNERFTRMLMNLAVCASDFSFTDRLTLFDPMCGKGTALFEALNRGYDACGSDLDKKALAESGDYFKKYLEFHRLKHSYSTDSRTVRGSGAVRAEMFRLDKTGLELQLACADAALCDRVFSKKRAHILISDLPYGVQHAPGGKQSFEDMLESVMPAWKNSILPGGAIALSFNTFTLPRDTVRAVMKRHGLTVMDGGCWDGITHWVEQAVNRDVAVCRR